MEEAEAQEIDEYEFDTDIVKTKIAGVFRHRKEANIHAERIYRSHTKQHGVWNGFGEEDDRGLRCRAWTDQAGFFQGRTQDRNDCEYYSVTVLKRDLQ